MSDEVSHGLVVQYLVSGFGSDDDFNERLAIEELVGGVLSADDNGESTGGDGGSGTMNAFFSVKNPARAREAVLLALREAGYLDEGMVVVHQTFNEDDETQDDVWWPEDYAFGFSTFGPFWTGMPAKSIRAKLSKGLQALQGQWRVTRYDTPDGSDASEWASDMRFLIARDQLLVRHQVAVISAGRIRCDAPGQIDLRPLLRPNKGGVTHGVYELRGDVLHLCIVAPGEDRPDGIAPDKQQQPGRMMMVREDD